MKWLINTVDHLLVKNNKGEGRGGGLKRGELSINFLRLKKRGGLLEREGLFERGGLIEDLSSVYSDAHLKWTKTCCWKSFRTPHSSNFRGLPSCVIKKTIISRSPFQASKLLVGFLVPVKLSFLVRLCWLRHMKTGRHSFKFATSGPTIFTWISATPIKCHIWENKVNEHHPPKK